MKLQPVILSGGAGTRLWPLSREQYPKQLLTLTGNKSMLQATACRMEGVAQFLPVVEEPIVVCNEAYRFITAQQLYACGHGTSQLILEPSGKNTAPALTLAALAAQGGKECADPVLLVMPADHVIQDQAAFEQAIREAFPVACDGAIVTFGIVPDCPETGYGYICPGEAISCSGKVYVVGEFVEKPDSETAERYITKGYLWNSGLFMVKASVWLEAITHFVPEISAACHKAFDHAVRDQDFVRIDSEAFSVCPSDSIDYAVMEKLASAPALGMTACVVQMAAGWSDVGAWDALWSLLEHDDAGNAVQGDVVLEDSFSNLVHASDRLVACFGVDNLVIVETPDAVLVARRDRTQDVKKLVSRLKAEGWAQAEGHRKVHRPWGYYDSVDAGERFQVKRIVVMPGASLSLQMHHHRAEHWIVVRGTARVRRGEETFLLSENQSTYIPLGVVHQLENPGKLPLEIIEVQSGTYLGEDDIIRFEDVYGR